MPLPKTGKQCKAVGKRNGQRCKNPCVTGYDVCRMHGAGTKAHPGGRPIIHGLYSKRAPITLRAKIEEFKSDPNLTAIEQDIALFRVLQANLIDKVKAAEGEGSEELKLPDPAEAVVMIELTEKIIVAVERWHRITNGEKFNVNISHYERFCDAVDKVIDEFVPEAQREAARAALADRLGRIVLGTTVVANAGKQG